MKKRKNKSKSNNNSKSINKSNNDYLKSTRLFSYKLGNYIFVFIISLIFFFPIFFIFNLPFIPELPLIISILFAIIIGYILSNNFNKDRGGSEFPDFKFKK